MKSITYKAAIKWLEDKKQERIEDRLIGVYNTAHHDVSDYRNDIGDLDHEMNKLNNSIGMIKDGIIAVRNNRKVADGLVAEMNKKVDKYNELVTNRNHLIEQYNKAVRLIENYDRDDEKELFFFWQMLHKLLPDDTSPWSEFKVEHKLFFYKNHIK